MYINEQELYHNRVTLSRHEVLEEGLVQSSERAARTCNLPGLGYRRRCIPVLQTIQLQALRGDQYGSNRSVPSGCSNLNSRTQNSERFLQTHVSIRNKLERGTADDYERRRTTRSGTCCCKRCNIELRGFQSSVIPFIIIITVLCIVQY
jgi:hypothetical protein